MGVWGHWASGVWVGGLGVGGRGVGGLGVRDRGVERGVGGRWVGIENLWVVATILDLGLLQSSAVRTHGHLCITCFSSNASIITPLPFRSSFLKAARSAASSARRENTRVNTRGDDAGRWRIYTHRLRWRGENSQPSHLRADGRVRVNATLRLPTEGRRCCSIRCNGGRGLRRRRASGGTAAAPQGRRGACTCDASAAEV